MRSRFALPALVIAALVLQRLLGLPGMSPYAAALLVPVPFLVGPPLLSTERRGYAYSFLLGLAWDVLFEPVIGPGAIAWSGAALAAWFLAGVVADRSPRAWAGLGVVCAFIIAALRACALYPLGIAPSLTWGWLGLSLLFTGLWCGLVGMVMTINVPGRWHVFRARKLR